MEELDRILEELRAIRDRLDAGPDMAERAELEKRRDELRVAAQLAVPGAPMNIARLKQQLETAEARLDEMLKSRIDVVRQAGGTLGGDFGATVDAMNINKGIDVAQDRAGLENRVRTLREQVRKLEEGSAT